MKKVQTFGCPLAIAVVAAMFLRLWQRGADFEDNGLLSPGPATWCFVIFVLLAAVGFFLLGRRLLERADFRGYLASFALPGKGWILTCLLAGGLLVAAGLLGVRDHQLGFNNQLSRYILSIALVPTGLDLALVGWLNAQKQESQGRFAWPLLVPGWCGCVWIIAAYQSHTAQPSAMSYAFYLLGALCAVGACYMMAAFSFERPRPLATAWLCAMGIILLATAIMDSVDQRDIQQRLVCLGYMVYLANQLKCLLYRTEVPAELEPWQPPQGEIPEEENEDEKLEVSEDE